MTCGARHRDPSARGEAARGEQAESPLKSLGMMSLDLCASFDRAPDDLRTSIQALVDQIRSDDADGIRTGLTTNELAPLRQQLAVKTAGASVKHRHCGIEQNGGHPVLQHTDGSRNGAATGMMGDHFHRCGGSPEPSARENGPGSARERMDARHGRLVARSSFAQRVLDGHRVRSLIRQRASRSRCSTVALASDVSARSSASTAFTSPSRKPRWRNAEKTFVFASMRCGAFA
jgi:hypothetical protein